jgi:hypothetical protein
MIIEIDPASAQAFMATSLKIERNGAPLTMGSALVALDIDPWSLAAELAVASRTNAVMRLEALLGRVPGGIPEFEIIARQAIATLAPPAVKGADLITVVRLAFRDPELVGAFFCFLAITALAVLHQVSIIVGDPLPIIVGYGIVALTFAKLSPHHGAALRPLLVLASGAIGIMFVIEHVVIYDLI